MHKTSSSKIPEVPCLQLLQTVFIQIQNIIVSVDILTNQICHHHLRTNSGTHNIDSQAQLREYKTSITSARNQTGLRDSCTITISLLLSTPHFRAELDHCFFPFLAQQDSTWGSFHFLTT
ncbi:hypothetical protein AMECASPLE_027882 [Ameca splendens]|uniref:Uncharacterized protein n=1 Tax=Ameca splendens TaxID=208324 RepID=A0ABV0Y5J5_9TELE